MTQYFGYNTSIWFKESPTFNATDAMDAGTLIGLYVKPGVSLNAVREIIDSEHIRGTRFKQSTDLNIGLLSCAGSIPFRVAYCSAFTFILKHLLGKVVTSGPVTGIYTHTFTFNELVFTGLSFAHNKVGATWKYHGCQLNSLKLSVGAGAYMDADVGVLGCREVIGAALSSVSPSALVTDPYIQSHHIVATVGGGSAKKLAGFDLEINSGIDSSPDKAYELGSAYPANLIPVAGGMSGTLRRRVQKDGDLTQGTFFSEHSASNAYKSIVITCTNPTTTGYTLVISFDAVFEPPDIKASDTGIIMEEVAFRDVNLATATIVVTDNAATPATATGTYNG